MLAPHPRALLGIVQHGAHRALEVRPLRRDRVLDRPVSGQTVQRGVKADVCLNEGQDRCVRAQLQACRERPLRRPPLRQGDGAGGDPFGGKPRREGLERGANLIKLADCNRIGRRDDQPAATILCHQPLLFEQLQRVADGLARHAQHPAEFFLANAPAGGERAVGDRLGKALISALDQRRLRAERLQRGPVLEFGILNYSCPGPVVNRCRSRSSAAAVPRNT
jgi:hypothetical protein